MFAPALIQAADTVLARFSAANRRLALAESCTGGLVMAVLTSLPGSSAVFDRGVVVYSNAAKSGLIGVPSSLIAAQGAVSQPVAAQMAEGMLARSAAEIALSITGIAGPGGATPGKPVGLVFIGGATARQTRVQEHHFDGDRQAIREAAAIEALKLALILLDDCPGQAASEALAP